MRTLTAIAALALVVPATASAAGSPEAARISVVVHDLDTTSVLAHWTPERIAAMPSGEVTPGAPAEDGPDGAPADAEWVNRVVGRLFFVNRGEDESCTATLVRSANRRTAVTGGHCAHTLNLIGEDPVWHEKMLFVPGFADGGRPHGSFVVERVVVSSTWVADDQRSEHDQAFLVLDRPSDAALPIAYGRPGGLPATEYGYPRAANRPGHQGRPEFTGMRMARCWGTPRPDPGHPELGPENLWGVPCDMGGGSSGGPRVARGAVVGVNTQSTYLDDAGNWCEWGTSTCTRHLVGPRFSRGITAKLHERAQRS
ncbi:MULTISPECIES: serine protease [Actinosynnema]|uniref:trypsin-like serine peptidase n=1 Tax=Actinosynnema TaxID=40566 RepID=UPI0020A48C3E|nr:hypothetical protein [Actinosynnema pretiosum]MCP2096702.1 hypothetical protein [Actinosynnema pretiosum]